MKHVLLFFILLPLFSPAQTGFQRTYGGPVSDQGFFAAPTNDGGFIVAGHAGSYGAGAEDAWLLKTAGDGSLQWSQAYGGTAHESVAFVTQLPDGSYVFCGETFSYGAGNGDAFMAKTDQSGALQWFKTYGEVNYDIAYSLQPTPDGGYVLCGLVESAPLNYDAFLVKTDANGDTLWTRVYGGPGIDHGVTVINTSDGGFLFSGKMLSYGAGSCDIYLVKTDANGDTLWTNIVGGPGWDEGMSVREIPGGGYAVCGGGNSYGSGDYDFYLLKLFNNGAVDWMKTYGGVKVETSYCLQLTHDGGFVFNGYTETFGPGHAQRLAQNEIPEPLGTDSANVFLIRTDANGDTLWCMTYGGLKKEESFYVAQLPDRGFAITGYSSSFGDSDNVYLVRTDSMGWSGCHERRAHPDVSSVTPVQTNAPSAITRGMQTGTHQPVATPVSSGTTLNCLTTSAPEMPGEKTIRIFPNPAEDFFQLGGLENGMHEIQLLDLSGRELSRVRQGGNAPVSLEGIARGIYFVRVDGKVAGMVVKK